VRRTAVLLAGSILAGCADPSLGVGPFRERADRGQPYLPIGLSRVPPLDPDTEGTATDLLLLSNTNMDQRFNAGTVVAWNLAALDALIGTSTSSEPRTLPFPDGVPNAVWKGGVFTLGGGGPVVTVTVEVRERPGGPVVPREFLVLPTRFDQSLTFVQVRTDGTAAPNGRPRTDDVEAGRRPGNQDDVDAIEFRPAIAMSATSTVVPFLSCRYPGEDNLGVTSCSRTFTIGLGFDDPFSLAVTRGPQGEGLVVGHLRQDRSGQFGVLSVLSPDELSSRLSAPDAVPPPAPDPTGGSEDDARCALARRDVIAKGFAPIDVAVERLDAVSFVTVAPALTSTLPSRAAPGIFAASNRRIDNVMNVVGVTQGAIDEAICDGFDSDFRPALPDDPPSLRRVQPELAFDVRSRTFANTHRGLAYAPPSGPGDEGRLWVAARIQEQIDSDTSAISTLSHDPTPEPGRDELRQLSTIALGEEIGGLRLSPFAPTGRRWLYALDARSDQIFILDVTEDEPILLNRIEGRFVEEGDRDRLRFTLATPMEIVFDRRNGRKRMYVSNFENSTIAVIDVTSDDPRKHRLVARIGRNINTAGRREGERRFFRDER